MRSTDNLKIQNFKPFETHRGLAYTADVLLDGVKVAELKNPGDGSYTRIQYFSEKDTIKEIMLAHFEKLGMNTENEKDYALEYTFAEHLVDMFINGFMSKEYLEMGILH